MDESLLGQTYVSVSGGMYSVISQGVPVGPAKASEREALQSVARFKNLKVSDYLWNGDKGKVEKRSYLHEGLYAKLAHAVTEYDRKQENKRHYNPYALPQYLARAAEIAEDVKRGADLREAITRGFTGGILSACLKAVGLTKATDTEARGGGAWVYMPVKAQLDKNAEG